MFLSGRRLATTLAVGGSLGYAAYNNDSVCLAAAGIRRSAVAAHAAALVAWDYHRNFPALPDDTSLTPDRIRLLEERTAVHVRCAERVRAALARNGGVYVKLGQHLAAMQYILPSEWCSTMQELQDRNTPSPLDDVARVVAADTGKTLSDLFTEFDEQPVGVASLAQVHRAVLRDGGTEVAIKVQHADVRAHSTADIATVSVLLAAAQTLFGDRLRLSWLATELRTSLPHELDFRYDRENAERAARDFAHAHIPLRIPPMLHASERVLIMGFVRGVRCDDLSYLRRHNIDPAQVSRSIADSFSYMTYVSGFLHCDPHPGNLFVCPRPGASPNFELVLLDHGLYRTLSPEFRHDYAEMWVALMHGDRDRIRYWSRRLAGTDLYQLFSVILTGRTWDTIESKSLSKTTTPPQFDIDALARQNPDLLSQISDILASVPPVLLLVLKTNDLLRMLDQKLFADQPPAVQRHAQLQTWVRLSRSCLVAVRQARAAHIKHDPARGLSITRAAQLAFNWIGFWFSDTVLLVQKQKLSRNTAVAQASGHNEPPLH
ncbi:hypothetical protein GGF46_000427 [Coemansia sp. RSA 552]|nr:hypothetical protein GGF46_000427 [Coemansia sp. RSA 552]